MGYLGGGHRRGRKYVADWAAEAGQYLESVTIASKSVVKASEKAILDNKIVEEVNLEDAIIFSIS